MKSRVLLLQDRFTDQEYHVGWLEDGRILS
jgi:hypothetical protein